jgi:hypothetical protein
VCVVDFTVLLDAFHGVLDSLGKAGSCQNLT